MREFKYKINGASYNVAIHKVTKGKIELDVNGKSYVVEVESVRSEEKTNDIPISKKSSFTPSRPQIASSQEVVSKGESPESVVEMIKSPLPGVVLDVKCKEGDQIAEGQVLLVLEAMKMENNITADRAGTIKSVLVRLGDSILEGADLVEIE